MLAPRKIYVRTFGCRLNQYESDGILQKILQTGCFVACKEEHEADFLLINTCTVTNQADLRELKWLRKVSHQYPETRIIVTGCLAQTDPHVFKQFSNVIFVMGNDHKTMIADVLREYITSGKQTQFTAINSSAFDYPTVFPQMRTRAYLKIQDGCHKRCSYCKIPQARGRARSCPSSQIFEHVRRLDDHGVPEIVLTGVNIGWYRDPESSIRFTELLEKILTQLKNARLRISSIEPCDVDEPLAKIMQHPRFCRFLHVPLQSGCPRILRAMKRSYSTTSYQKRIERIRYYNPNIFLGTDIIVGFPSESNKDFQETLQFCHDLEFANIHPFPYSVRDGTEASFYGPKIPRKTIKERFTLLQILRKDLWKKYSTKQLQQTRSIVIEKIKKTADGLELTGLSDDFLRVRLAFNNHEFTPYARHLARGSILDVRLMAIQEPRVGHSTFWTEAVVEQTKTNTLTYHESNT